MFCLVGQSPLKIVRRSHFVNVLNNWEIRLSPNLGQIDPKWDKSVIFKDYYSVHFYSPREKI